MFDGFLKRFMKNKVEDYSDYYRIMKNPRNRSEYINSERTYCYFAMGIFIPLFFYCMYESSLFVLSDMPLKVDKTILIQISLLPTGLLFAYIIRGLEKRLSPLYNFELYHKLFLIRVHKNIGNDFFFSKNYREVNKIIHTDLNKEFKKDELYIPRTQVQKNIYDYREKNIKKIKKYLRKMKDGK